MNASSSSSLAEDETLPSSDSRQILMGELDKLPEDIVARWQSLSTGKLVEVRRWPRPSVGRLGRVTLPSLLVILATFGLTFASHSDMARAYLRVLGDALDDF